MMVKRRSERFRFFVPAALLALIAACSSAPTLTSAADKPSTPSDPDIQGQVISVSTPEAPGAASAKIVGPMDGTIAIVSVHLAPGLEAKYPGGPTVSGEFDSISLPFYKDGDAYRAVLGVPLDHKAGPTVVKVHVGTGADARVADVPLIVVSGNYPTTTETLKVDKRLVQPQNPKDLARIKKEQAEIGEIYGTVTAKKYWSGPFAFPVKDASYTSSFGKRRVYNGVQTSPHTGLDLKAKQGTPIFAAAPGKVVLAKNLFFTGNTVILDHGYGVLTLYAHMSKLKTPKGTEVAKGDLLGLAGMTGRANGPHLHWMAIVQKQKVNPLGLTQVMK